MPEKELVNKTKNQLYQITLHSELKKINNVATSSFILSVDCLKYDYLKQSHCLLGSVSDFLAISYVHFLLNQHYHPLLPGTEIWDLTESVNEGFPTYVLVQR